MLELKNIKKNYKTSSETVHALRDISITFRSNEFVSILGASGCGKTTLLNIIGGLDRYTAGDLIIDGVSTKKYKDKDFDTYRNHKIGFVFQNYNLISHQTVLSNVELSLTLAGSKKKERRIRALEVLEKVGLKDQINKKPNEMSGGQMQRVAIARALINNPDIILLDEPTGALDSVTSVEIMELLKDIAKDKLIIMVTHNKELAESYSNRIVKLLDGRIIDDNNPYKKEKQKTKDNESKKTSMSFLTALRLSFNNLLTKKGRTFLTAFAGSIGIIGIALILSLSNGVQNYIDKLEEDTLSSYPITIEKKSVDLTGMIEEFMKIKEKSSDSKNDKITSKNIMNNMLESMTGDKNTNNLKKFKEYLENNKEIKNNIGNIQYGYNLKINAFNKEKDNDIVKVNPTDLYDQLGFGNIGELKSSMISENMDDDNVWKELYSDEDMMNSQFDIVSGHLPKKYNEIVLIVDQNNQISDYALYTLGYLNQEELIDNMQKFIEGKKVETNKTSFYNYKDFIGDKFKLVLNTDYYVKEKGVWTDKSDNKNFIKNLIKDKEDLKIVGIIKPSNSSNNFLIYGGIGYTKDLTEYVINKTKKEEIVKDQLNNKNINIFTGNKFGKSFSMNDLSNEQKMYIMGLSDSEKLKFYDKYKDYSEATYESNLEKLGYIDLKDPSYINIYAKDFDSKEIISKDIEKYNNNQKQEDIINYTDIVGVLMSSVKKIVNMISYVLIAFVAVSLVVSSIMIGIITYISVLERTKEIGILRSLGASKKDISRVFNAETFIIGLTSGLIGVGVTILITVPTSIIVEHYADIENVAKLPLIGALILIAISAILTIIAGLIPSKIASKKDPVESLRTGN